jgi:uncharacterized caspase-like protein
LYRKAWGLPEDDVIFQSAANREQEVMRELLNEQLQEKNQQIENLDQQIAQLQSSVARQQDNAQAQAEIQELRNALAALERDRESTLTQYSAIPIFREPTGADVAAQPIAGSTLPYDAEYGRFYALVIGNQDYLRLPDLQSPHNDASRIAELLESKYGFIVETLLDANYIQIRQAINDLNNVLTEEDNLLIFYAGHGTRVQTGNVEKGYWLPVNADAAPNNTFWVENEFITSHLQLLNAKRILVVADSCYAGLLSDAREFRAFGGEIPTYNEAQFRFKLQRKSRLLISSGGDEPVLDNAGQGNSVFAKAFLDVLESNTKILAGPELFIRVRDLVRVGARAVDFEQEPEFKTIDFTGNEFGDFFFVPREI